MKTFTEKNIENAISKCEYSCVICNYNMVQEGDMQWHLKSIDFKAISSFFSVIVSIFGKEIKALDTGKVYQYLGKVYFIKNRGKS